MADEQSYRIPVTQKDEHTEEEERSKAGANEQVIETCEDLLKRKDAEVKEIQDRLLRMAAEMDNTRKRLEREKADSICFANESLIREMLPVLDNLERAVQHGEKDTDFDSLLQGVRMTLKGFLDALGKFGCTPFQSLGEPFDPNYHEAIMQQPGTDQPDNTVVQELQKGYTLNDRLLRPAMVVVAKGEKD